MGKFVLPKSFMLGYTDVNVSGLINYLQYTKQEDFLATFNEALESGVSAAECLISFYAKLCYKSLTMGKNSNLKRVRDIPDNIASIITTAHMSVFEHVSINFVVTDCSRVYTHEQVRHRQGTNYSQTSGRYCRLDSIDLVFDPILEPARDLWEGHLRLTEDLVYLTECRLGLRKPPCNLSATDVPMVFDPDEPIDDDSSPAVRLLHIGKRPGVYETFTPALKVAFDKAKALADAACESDAAADAWVCPEDDSLDREVQAALRWVPDDQFDFTKRKQITSAIRRIAPNGQANEMGMTLNVRALRHTILLRTARHAEWEIRVIFAQIYELVSAKFPYLFKDAKIRTVDGLPEVYGMKSQPYDLDANSPDALKIFTDPQILAEFKARNLVA